MGYRSNPILLRLGSSISWSANSFAKYDYSLEYPKHLYVYSYLNQVFGSTFYAARVLFFSHIAFIKYNNKYVVNIYLFDKKLITKSRATFFWKLSKGKSTKLKKHHKIVNWKPWKKHIRFKAQITLKRRKLKNLVYIYVKYILPYLKPNIFFNKSLRSEYLVISNFIEKLNNRSDLLNIFDQVLRYNPRLLLYSLRYRRILYSLKNYILTILRFIKLITYIHNKTESRNYEYNYNVSRLNRLYQLLNFKIPFRNFDSLNQYLLNKELKLKRKVNDVSIPLSNYIYILNRNVPRYNVKNKGNSYSLITKHTKVYSSILRQNNKRTILRYLKLKSKKNKNKKKFKNRFQQGKFRGKINSRFKKTLTRKPKKKKILKRNKLRLKIKGSRKKYLKLKLKRRNVTFKYKRLLKKNNRNRYISKIKFKKLRRFGLFRYKSLGRMRKLFKRYKFRIRDKKTEKKKRKHIFNYLFKNILKSNFRRIAKKKNKRHLILWKIVKKRLIKKLVKRLKLFKKKKKQLRYSDIFKPFAKSYTNKGIYNKFNNFNNRYNRYNEFSGFKNNNKFKKFNNRFYKGYRFNRFKKLSKAHKTIKKILLYKLIKRKKRKYNKLKKKFKLKCRRLLSKYSKTIFHKLSPTAFNISKTPFFYLSGFIKQRYKKKYIINRYKYKLLFKFKNLSKTSWEQRRLKRYNKKSKKPLRIRKLYKKYRMRAFEISLRTHVPNNRELQNFLTIRNKFNKRKKLLIKGKRKYLLGIKREIVFNLKLNTFNLSICSPLLYNLIDYLKYNLYKKIGTMSILLYKAFIPLYQYRSYFLSYFKFFKRLWYYRISNVLKRDLVKLIDSSVLLNFITVKRGSYHPDLITKFIVFRLLYQYRYGEVVRPLLKELNRNRVASGIKGLMIVSTGRLTRRQRSSKKGIVVNKANISKLSAKVLYSFNQVRLRYGMTGIKLYVNYGEVKNEKK